MNVRIAATAHRDPQQVISLGLMHADFFQHLSVFPLRVPALHEREGDVLILPEYLLEQTRAQLNLSGLRLAAETQTARLGYPCLGNVRELEHCIHRAVLHALQRMPA